MFNSNSNDENSQDQENQETTEGCCSAEVKKTLCKLLGFLFVGFALAVIQGAIDGKAHRDGWSPFINPIFNLIVNTLAIAFLWDKGSKLNKSLGKKFESGEWQTPCQRLGQLATKFGIHSASGAPADTDPLLAVSVDKKQTRPQYQPG